MLLTKDSKINKLAVLLRKKKKKVVILPAILFSEDTHLKI